MLAYMRASGRKEFALTPSLGAWPSQPLPHRRGSPLSAPRADLVLISARRGALRSRIDLGGCNHITGAALRCTRSRRTAPSLPHTWRGGVRGCDGARRVMARASWDGTLHRPYGRPWSARSTVGPGKPEPRPFARSRSAADPEPISAEPLEPRLIPLRSQPEFVRTWDVKPAPGCAIAR